MSALPHLDAQVVYGYLVSHALAVATVIASLLTALRLLESRRTPQSTFAWLLAVIFMPFVAVPLYLLIGSRKFPKAAKGAGRAPPPPPGDADHPSAAPGAPERVARVLRASGVAPPCHENSFTLLPTGELAYEALLGLVAGATQSIDLTIFILGRDTAGDAVVAALAERARQGVRVRVLVDGVGSERSQRRAARLLDAAGAELRVFMPLRHSPMRGRTNLRSHRKLAVFDGTAVFAGGMNIADEYMGLPLPAGSQPRWRDVAAITRGPLARDASALFESDWSFCGGAKAPATALSPRDTTHGAPQGEEVLQIVPSGPDMRTDTVYDLFLMTIFEAKERISLVTPYYVPDDLLQHALVLAARRGVKVELVIPSKSNHGMADLARRKLLRELVDSGVVIRYYERGMVHAKAMVVDDTFAYVGSPNFDQRSLFLNYEVALCTYSAGAIGQIRDYVQALAGECTTEGPRTHGNWVFEQMARLLAPEL